MYVYILKSLIKDRYYTGCIKNHDRRLAEHNSGRTRSTKAYRPWKIVYIEKFRTETEAYKREKEIKSFKSGLKFKELQESESWQSG
ncbi:MAG: GIY-YIG nuclease family protein [Ignavibacteriaceae bacterium]